MSVDGSLAEDGLGLARVAAVRNPVPTAMMPQHWPGSPSRDWAAQGRTAETDPGSLVFLEGAPRGPPPSLHFIVKLPPQKRHLARGPSQPAAFCLLQAFSLSDGTQGIRRHSEFNAVILYFHIM